MMSHKAMKLALNKAFQLGQRYWSWADSEYSSHWKKADAAKAEFDKLVEDTLRTAIEAAEKQELVTKEGQLRAMKNELWNTPPAAPVQEPIAWATTVGSYAHVSWGKERPDYPIRYEVPLYTTPPEAQRQWVGLTDEEIDAIWDAVITPSNHIREFVRAIEATLREQNTP
jgi:hypothetical protein